ncbi:hypothetical protein IC235_18690 [Hymenobacter sp. BT664]|uniref:Uncharacterized protein n=1 Tax=Hymenobacter montanus TaxID=2771359 RepID=A0A927BH58_9BACT|nr:hypothetical protein [Hymenobacter montanus]
MVAKQFTTEMMWTLSDFLAAGILLFGSGLAYVLLAQMGSNTAYRAAAGVAVGVALFLVWANLAVGLIGSENNPANRLYGGVLAILFIGALVARFRPRGMANALFVTALAQMIVPAIALLVWKTQIISEAAAPGGVGHILGVNAFFAALWGGAALLFRRASTTSANPDRQLG